MKQNNLLKLIAIGAFCSVPFIMSGCAAVAVGAATGTTGAIIGSDSRTIDSMFYDETIEQNAYKIFKENEKLSKKDDFSVSVISMSGNVLLVGQTINSEYFNSCLEKIKRLDYVRKVYNFVTFKQPVSAGVTANDTYITSKIKTKLLFGENIRSGRFKVVTEDSMVYLLGYVTRDEAIRAVNEVQKIDGVKKIYTIFDYMENVPCIDIVGSGFFDSVGLYRKCHADQRQQATRWMEVFGIGHLAERSFLTLSSGEQRLALLARAFVKEPDLLILDEPLHGLDHANKQLARKVIEQYCQIPKKSLIYVTHYLHEIPSCVTQRFELKKTKE